MQFRFANTSVDDAGSSGAFALVNGFSIAPDGAGVIPEPSSSLVPGLLIGIGLLRRRR